MPTPPALPDASLRVHIPTHPPSPVPSSSSYPTTQPSSPSTSIQMESSTTTVTEGNINPFQIFEPKHNFFDQEFQQPHCVFLLTEVEEIHIPEPEEEDDPITHIETQIIAAICDELTRNPAFYKNLIAEFGKDGTIPGVEDLVVHDFVVFHNATCWAEQHQPSLYNEEDLLQLPEEYIHNPNWEQGSANLTPPASPHPSTGLMPVVCARTSSSHSGKTLSQSSTLWTTAPSQIKERESEN